MSKENELKAELQGIKSALDKLEIEYERGMIDIGRYLRLKKKYETRAKRLGLDEMLATTLSRVDSYLADLRDYCANLPYLTLDIRLPRALGELYVPLQVRQKDPLETEQNEPMSIAEMVRRSKDTPVLILGEPGAGKSTLLHQLAEQAWDASERIGLDEPHLPILITLRQLARAKDQEIGNRLANALPTPLVLTQKLPDGFLEDWSAHTGRRWLILLDAWDEVPAGERLEFLIGLKSMLKGLEQHRIIITSRLPGYEADKLADLLTRYELLPLMPEQMDEFAHACFSDRADHFLGELERVRLSDLCGTPLILTIAAIVFQRTKSALPKRRSELYKEIVEIWLGEANEIKKLHDELGDRLTGSHELQKARLAYLALQMTQRPGDTSLQTLSSFVAEYLQTEEQLPPVHAQDSGKRFIEVMARRSGVFIRHGKDTYDFVHPTFREYFAALAIVELGCEKILGLARLYKSSPDWRGIFVFTSTLLDEQKSEKLNSSQFVAALLADSQLPIYRDRSLARKLFASLRHYKFSKSGHRLAQHIECALQRALFCVTDCLADDVSVSDEVREKIFLHLDTCARSGIIPLCELATKALASLKHTRHSHAAAETAMSLLADPRWYNTRKAGAEALGELRVQLPALEPALVFALADPMPQVRRAAAMALGKLEIASPDVQHRLFELILTDRDKQHFTLRGSREEDWTDASTIFSGEFLVVPAAAQALRKVGGVTPSRVSSVCRLLQSNDPNSRQAAACALGRLGEATPQVVSALINALGDTYRADDYGEKWAGVLGTTRWVVWEAARSLLLLKQFSNEVVNALADAVRREAAYIKEMRESMVEHILEKHGTKGSQAVKALVDNIPRLGWMPAPPNLQPLWEQGEKAFIKELYFGKYASANDRWIAKKSIIEALGYIENPSAQVYNALLFHLDYGYEALVEAAWLSLSRQAAWLDKHGD